LGLIHPSLLADQVNSCCDSFWGNLRDWRRN